MTLDEKLKAYSDSQTIPKIDEECVKKTILASKEALYQSELESPLSGIDFLFHQIRYIRKRWWIAQALVLLALWIFLFISGSGVAMQRSMGIMAPVFVILLLPELWKNQSNASMEVEAASYFSIRKIYAARMTLFAIADLLMLSLFFTVSIVTLKLTVGEMIIQFFLPMNVPCCICFRNLCSNREESGYTAFLMSLVWIAVWMMIVLQERIYRRITAPIWAGVIILSFVYLIYSVCKVWKNCEKYWEVNHSWN